MTRETKIGLIVAGSFLCLVCVVVASKWRRGDDKEPEEQTIQVAAVKTAPKSNTPEAKKNDAAPKKEGEPKIPVSVEPRPMTDLKPPPVIIPPPVEGFQFPPLEPAPTVGGVGPGKTPEVKITPPPTVVKDPAPKFEIGGPGTLMPPPPLTQVQEKKVVLEMPPVVGLPGDPKPASLPFTDKDQPLFPPLKPAVPTESPKEKPKDAPPLLAAPPKDAGPGALVFPKLPLPEDSSPMLPPLGTPTPLPKNDNSSPPSLTLPKDPPPIRPIEDTTPKLIPRIPAGDLPSVTPPSAGSPLPMVRDVSTEPYTCVPGDTSFAVLSKRFYGSEKYADALLAYNQEHAKWIKNGQALLTNPPTLQPGQNVEQPPVSILERSYKGWIRATSGSAVPTIPSATPGIKPPVTLGTPPGVATVSVPPNLGKGGTYKVQNPNGESVFDVAERTLGNRNLWPEIWRVNQTNPAVRPPAPIPFGTELKLP